MKNESKHDIRRPTIGFLKKSYLQNLYCYLDILNNMTTLVRRESNDVKYLFEGIMMTTLIFSVFWMRFPKLSWYMKIFFLNECVKQKKKQPWKKKDMKCQSDIFIIIAKIHFLSMELGASQWYKCGDISMYEKRNVHISHMYFGFVQLISTIPGGPPVSKLYPTPPQSSGTGRFWPFGSPVNHRPVLNTADLSPVHSHLSPIFSNPIR